MSTVRPSGAGDEAVGTGEVRDGGSIIKGGAVASDSPVTNSLSLADIADDFGAALGSKVIANDGTGAATTDRVGVRKALSGGTLAYNAGATKWVIQGGNVTSTLSGAANTALKSAAADSNGANATRDGINQVSAHRVLGSGVTTSIDPLKAPSTTIKGYFTKGGDAGSSRNFIDPAVAGGATDSADSAANPTRAIPGELTYMFGGKNPKDDNYKSKETPES
jgi:hypothetical protein